MKTIFCPTDGHICNTRDCPTTCRLKVIRKERKKKRRYLAEMDQLDEQIKKNKKQRKR